MAEKHFWSVEDIPKKKKKLLSTVSRHDRRIYRLAVRISCMSIEPHLNTVMGIMEPHLMTGIKETHRHYEVTSYHRSLTIQSSLQTKTWSRT